MVFGIKDMLPRSLDTPLSECHPLFAVFGWLYFHKYTVNPKSKDKLDPKPKPQEESEHNRWASKYNTYLDISLKDILAGGKGVAWYLNKELLSLETFKIYLLNRIFTATDNQSLLKSNMPTLSPPQPPMPTTTVPTSKAITLRDCLIQSIPTSISLEGVHELYSSYGVKASGPPLQGDSNWFIWKHVHNNSKEAVWNTFCHAMYTLFLQYKQTTIQNIVSSKCADLIKLSFAIVVHEKNLELCNDLKKVFDLLCLDAALFDYDSILTDDLINNYQAKQLLSYSLTVTALTNKSSYHETNGKRVETLVVATFRAEDASFVDALLKRLKARPPVTLKVSSHTWHASWINPDEGPMEADKDNSWIHFAGFVEEIFNSETKHITDEHCPISSSSAPSGSIRSPSKVASEYFKEMEETEKNTTRDYLQLKEKATKTLSQMSLQDSKRQEWVDYLVLLDKTYEQILAENKKKKNTIVINSRGGELTAQFQMGSGQIPLTLNDLSIPKK